MNIRLIRAVRQSDIDTVRQLLNNSQQEEKINVNDVIDYTRNETAIMYAVLNIVNNKEESKKHLLYSILDLLLAHGADINSAIALADKHKADELIKHLFSKNVAVELEAHPHWLEYQFKYAKTIDLHAIRKKVPPRVFDAYIQELKHNDQLEDLTLSQSVAVPDHKKVALDQTAIDVHAALQALTECRSLKRLALSFSSIDQKDIPKVLALSQQNPFLESAVLMDAKALWVPNIFYNFRAVRELDFSGNQCTDKRYPNKDLMRDLRFFTSLTSLKLSKCELSIDQVSDIFPYAPRLRTLNLTEAKGELGEFHKYIKYLRTLRAGLCVNDSIGELAYSDTSVGMTLREGESQFFGQQETIIDALCALNQKKQRLVDIRQIQLTMNALCQTHILFSQKAILDISLQYLEAIVYIGKEIQLYPPLLSATEIIRKIFPDTIPYTLTETIDAGGKTHLTIVADPEFLSVCFEFFESKWDLRTKWDLRMGVSSDRAGVCACAADFLKEVQALFQSTIPESFNEYKKSIEHEYRMRLLQDLERDYWITDFKHINEQLESKKSPLAMRDFLDLMNTHNKIHKEEAALLRRNIPRVDDNAAAMIVKEYKSRLFAKDFDIIHRLSRIPVEEYIEMPGEYDAGHFWGTSVLIDIAKVIADEDEKSLPAVKKLKEIHQQLAPVIAVLKVINAVNPGSDIATENRNILFTDMAFLRLYAYLHLNNEFVNFIGILQKNNLLVPQVLEAALENIRYVKQIAPFVERGIALKQPLSVEGLLYIYNHPAQWDQLRIALDNNPNAFFAVFNNNKSNSPLEQLITQLLAATKKPSALVRYALHGEQKHDVKIPVAVAVPIVDEAKAAVNNILDVIKSPAMPNGIPIADDLKQELTNLKGLIATLYASDFTGSKEAQLKTHIETAIGKMKDCKDENKEFIIATLNQFVVDLQPKPQPKGK